MTKARFWEREGCRCLEVTGHAGFDQSGRDIVCAACSIIVQALAAALEARLVDGSDATRGAELSVRPVGFGRKRGPCGPLSRRDKATRRMGVRRACRPVGRQATTERPGARAAKGGSCDLTKEESQLGDSGAKGGEGPAQSGAAKTHVGLEARAAKGGSCDPWGEEPGISASYGMDAGRFWLVCSAASQRVERRDDMFDMAHMAFRLLEGAYPEHVRLIDDADQSMVK